MEKNFSSFKEFFENSDFEFERQVEVAFHNDENIANNRLFVWHFEEVDLEEFLEYFQVYKNSAINVSSRQALSGNLMRKMNSMMREGYNPIECMLYASKTINMKMQNDKELQEMLGERIKDVYIKQETETISVIEHIMNMWTWGPQVSAVIMAIGLIGDNQELLDGLMVNYAEDPNYKSKVFYALMKNKSINNLERVMKIIMSLQDTDEDNKIGRAFIKEIIGFGYEGIKIVEKYYDNPGVSRIGGRILKKIMLKDSNIAAQQDDDLFRRTLANKSGKDDLAYKDFLEDCYMKYDNDAFYLSRFSRPEIGSFLKSALEDPQLDERNKNTAIVSMGIIGAKGYAPAAAVIAACEEQGKNEYAVIAANILLNNEEYADRLVDILCKKKDYELSEVYSILRASSIINYRISMGLVQQSLEKRFRHLLETEDYDGLDCLTSNFQMLWDKKLYSLLSKNILEQMREVLVVYAEHSIPIPSQIIISILETIVHSWNSAVEKAVFALYKQADDSKVQELSFKKLKERTIEAPR